MAAVNSLRIGHTRADRQKGRTETRSWSALTRRVLCMYCVIMKNITVSVDDEVYHRARVRAAELRTSVSAMVKKTLEEIAGQETDFERLRREEHELRVKIKARAVPFRASQRLSREELHDRHALR
jgi:hypothetical protein